MGFTLTRKYAACFDTGGLRRCLYIFAIAFRFIRDTHHNGKVSELLSFVVWEICHKLRLWPRNSYLRFNDVETVRIGDEISCRSDFEQSIDRLLASKGLRLLSSQYAWKLLFTTLQGELYGSLWDDPNTLYKSVDSGNSLIPVDHFVEEIISIFVSSNNVIFVCIKGVVYHSVDDGRSFRTSLVLSSSESHILFGKGTAEAPDKTLIFGEYGNIATTRGWQSCANLYFSTDNGVTWKKEQFLIKRGINKHVHCVSYSRVLKQLLVTVGDNKKELWIGQSSKSFDADDVSWKRVNRFHIQMGGYLSIAETDDAVLLGTDYLGGTNFLVERKRSGEWVKMTIPDPYRRSPFEQMVTRRSKTGNEMWANLHSDICDDIKCLLMHSADGGKTWDKVVEYDGMTHWVTTIGASSVSSDVLWFMVRGLENRILVYKIVDRASQTDHLCASGDLSISA